MKTIKPMTMISLGAALIALPAAAFAGNYDSNDKFKMMDADGDGRISRSEHQAGAHQMFAKLDANGDGIVTAAEMAVKKETKADSTARESSSTRGNPDAAVQAAADKIKVIDQNGDGQLTAAEHDAGSAAMFDKMDTDGDGYLTPAELRAGHKSMK